MLSNFYGKAPAGLGLNACAGRLFWRQWCRVIGVTVLFVSLVVGAWLALINYSASFSAMKAMLNGSADMSYKVDVLSEPLASPLLWAMVLVTVFAWILVCRLVVDLYISSLAAGSVRVWPCFINAISVFCKPLPLLVDICAVLWVIGLVGVMGWFVVMVVLPGFVSVSAWSPLMTIVILSSAFLALLTWAVVYGMLFFCSIYMLYHNKPMMDAVGSVVGLVRCYVQSIFKAMVAPVAVLLLVLLLGTYIVYARFEMMFIWGLIFDGGSNLPATMDMLRFDFVFYVMIALVFIQCLVYLMALFVCTIQRYGKRWS